MKRKQWIYTFETGFLEIEELTCMLNSLPMNAFVDKDDIVNISHNQAKNFCKNKAIIRRTVKLPSSPVFMVEEIVKIFS